MQEAKRYSIIRPTEKRDRFTLSCFILQGRKKEYHPLEEKIRNQSHQINQQYQNRIINNSEAEVLLNELIQSEYQRLQLKHIVLKNSTISAINQKLFNKFWEKIYTVRYLSDENSPKYSILKAIRLIEPLSLQTASASQLQNKLKSSGATIPEIRRATDNLNQILRFLNRDFRLNKPNAPYAKVQYLTEKEFQKVLKGISEPDLKDFATALFSTGMRLSEALAVQEKDYRNGIINVDKQLTKAGEIKAPKREKIGRSVVLSLGTKAVQKWVKIQDKDQYRAKLYDVLMDASMKAFPDDSSKWISPHDLRHSHAIHLLSLGANLTQVALNLRNRIDVCQKYYTGFEHSDSTLESLKKII